MKWLTILFALFIILIIVLADLGKLGILYGILTLLINLTLFRSIPFQGQIRVAIISDLTLALLIGLEEFSQRYFSSRTFSLGDLTASYLGVIFFSWLALRRKKVGT